MPVRMKNKSTEIYIINTPKYIYQFKTDDGRCLELHSSEILEPANIKEIEKVCKRWKEFK